MSTTTTGSGRTRNTGRHPVNVGHLVMGVAFLGLVGVWALIQGDVVANGDVRWLLPVPWVLAGLAGLLAIGLAGSRRWTTRHVGWVDTGAPVDDTYTLTDLRHETEADPEMDPEMRDNPDEENR